MGCSKSKLKRKIDSSRSELFVDPDFQPFKNTRTTPAGHSTVENLEWKRPHQIVEAPRLYVDGTSRRDVIQGVLGDCWLLSTCAALAKREDLLHKVLSPNQHLYGEKYNGSIRVKLWTFGEWKEVQIDDLVPMKKGKFVYGHCADKTEFWVHLLEKAFAKMRGSYSYLEGGMPIEAMVDLTGGLAERYELKDPSEHQKMYEYLRRAFAARSFITCSRKGDWRQAHQADHNGLVQGHAYSVTGIYRVESANGTRHNLVRIRNPWGDNFEWQGDWSDKSELWETVDDSTKRSMGVQNLADGEFWMDFFQDFVREFEEISFCTLGPDFDRDGVVDNFGAFVSHRDAWKPFETAGGCRNNLSLYVKNPMFEVTLPEENNNIIICLSQRKIGNERLHQIGFSIYESDGRGEVDAYDESFFAPPKSALGTSGHYVNYREVFGRFSLPRGRILVIPATFEANVGADFLLRIYCDNKMDFKKIR